MGGVRERRIPLRGEEEWCSGQGSQRCGWGLTLRSQEHSPPPQWVRPEMICREGQDFPEEAGPTSSRGGFRCWQSRKKNLGKIQGGLIQACRRQAGASGAGPEQGRCGQAGALVSGAARTQYHGLGGSNDKQTFIFSNSGGWKSEIQVPAELVSPETSLLGG